VGKMQWTEDGRYAAGVRDVHVGIEGTAEGCHGHAPERGAPGAEHKTMWSSVRLW